MLSALPTGQARKVLVKQMWESGAEVMVSIAISRTYNQLCCGVGIDNALCDRFSLIIAHPLGSNVLRRLENIS